MIMTFSASLQVGHQKKWTQCYWNSEVVYTRFIWNVWKPWRILLACFRVANAEAQRDHNTSIQRHILGGKTKEKERGEHHSMKTHVLKKGFDDGMMASISSRHPPHHVLLRGRETKLRAGRSERRGSPLQLSYFLAEVIQLFDAHQLGRPRGAGAVLGRDTETDVKGGRTRSGAEPRGGGGGDWQRWGGKEWDACIKVCGQSWEFSGREKGASRGETAMMPRETHPPNLSG